MSILEQIQELRTRLEAINLILSGISAKTNEIISCMSLVGTDTYNKILQFQSTLNSEAILIQKMLNELYTKVDKTRDLLLGLPENIEVVSSPEEDVLEDPENDEEEEDDEDEMMDEYSGEPNNVILTELEEAASNNLDDYLVVIDKNKITSWHLQVKRNGEYDRGLCGAAWAALFSKNGFRGNKYSGPKINEAKRKLKQIYKKQGWEFPDSGK